MVGLRNQRLLWLALWPALLAASTASAADFDTEIVPVFTKAGCNAGSCHGAAAGRGGFRLSLFGSDPAADYNSVVLELEGRRVNLARPAESLVLAKPTGLIAHEGGVRLEEGNPGERRLTEWIAAGAPRAKSPRKLTHFQVEPASAVVGTLDTKLPLSATARFDNGDPVDVTAWTVFSSSDSGAIEIESASGQAIVRRRGQHVVIARFLDRVVPLQFTVPHDGPPIDLSKERRASFVDDEVIKSLTRLRLPMSSRADDATFLRRVCLDLTGKLPTNDEVAALLADLSPDRRAQLVERLLKGEAFVEYWTYRTTKLLRIRPQPNDKVGAKVFHDWVREQIRVGTPWNEVARSLLTTTGDSHSVGPANFSRMAGDARAQAELVSQVFLGARLQCANCHNHPLDRWTQDDYHGLAAVFARLERGRIVRVAERGAVTNPRTGEPALQRIPGERFLEETNDGRAALANWLTNSDNRYFARATVNRLWSAMFGRGIIDATDDLRETNPATHPELLDRLAADFIESKYDIRHTLRLIANSETYCRSNEANGANRTDDRFYSHAMRRPLEAEVLADAIADVTGVPDRYGDHPLGMRAVALADPTTPARSLDVLGRCSRTVSCEGNVAVGGLPAKLHKINGLLINGKIGAREGRLQKLIDSGASSDAIVAEFYVRALGRSPTEREREFWRTRLNLTDAAERRGALEDFVWSLLNCSEFTTNH